MNQHGIEHRTSGEFSTHWPIARSRFTHTQCLFFIGYRIHQRNDYFSIAMVYTDTVFVLHWSQLTFTQSLFFMSHGLHSRIPYFLLITAYSHAMLVLHLSQLTPINSLFSCSHFVDFIYGRMDLSTTSAGIIAGQVDILQCLINADK